MKKPKTPPPTDELWTEAIKNNRLESMFSTARAPSVGYKYHHWDKLLYYSPPGDLSHREWWLALKLCRQPLFKSVPLRDMC